MKYIVQAMVAVSFLVSIAMLSNCGGGPSQPLPLTISTASLPNGTLEIPYSQTIQASGGVGPFSWSVSAGALPQNLTLISSETNAVTISGTPGAAVQAVPFTIEVTDSANESATQPYTVSIVVEPNNLTFSPPSLSFLPPQQVIGTVSTAQTETLTNTGTSEVVISNIALTGTNAADFSQSNTCGSSLAAAANCAINVNFTPSQLGPRSASITITDNTTGSPASVSLSGVGLTSGPDATLSATSLNFNNQAVGTTSSAQSITMSNYGTMTLSGVNIAASTNFGETSTCDATLLSGAECTIDVTFKPSEPGKLTGTLSVTDNAPDSPQTCSLSGGSCGRERSPCSSGPGSSNSCCTGLVCSRAEIGVGRVCCPPSNRSCGND
jgi:Abnormal spindle-like microcephaly-assoc'd, ASPM-SPD-2-Hydin